MSQEGLKGLIVVRPLEVGVSRGGAILATQAPHRGRQEDTPVSEPPTNLSQHLETFPQTYQNGTCPHTSTRLCAREWAPVTLLYVCMDVCARRERDYML